MTWSLQLAGPAQKDFRKLPSKDQARVRVCVRKPVPPLLHPTEHKSSARRGPQLRGSDQFFLALHSTAANKTQLSNTLVRAEALGRDDSKELVVLRGY